MKVEGMISLRLKILTLLLTPILLYWQDFIIIANEAFNNDLSTHIILIPFLLGYMIYSLKEVLFASVSWPSKDVLLFNLITLKEAVGVLLCALAYLVKWYGSYSFNPLEYHIASIPILVSGLILVLFNTQTLRILVFPIAFLVFLIPPPIDFAHQAGTYLAVMSANVSFLLLKVVGFPVNLYNQYGSPIIYLTKPNGYTIPFTIDIACSGLYSFIGLLIFTTFFAYISKGSISKKFAVFVTSFPIIYALNILRITTLILIGYYLGTGLSMNVFHLLGGWTLIFAGTLIILTLADKIFDIRILKQESMNCNHEIKDSKGDYCLQCGKILKVRTNPLNQREALKLVTILVITILALSIQVPVFALSIGKSEIFTEDPHEDVKIKNVLPQIEGYDLTFVYRDTRFQEISGQNASLMYGYYPIDESGSNIWVGLEISSTKSNLHRWEACLIIMPEIRDIEVYNKIDLRDIHLLDNPPLTARYFAYNSVGSNTTEVILYWYTQSMFKTDNDYQTLWTKISVIEYATSPENYQEAELDILPVAKAIANYWRPISTWSGIGITIAKNGQILITITTIILALATTYGQHQQRKISKKAIQLYNQLNDLEDKAILDALKSSNKPMNEHDIAIKYTDLTDKEIDKDTLNKKLKKAEEIGIINMNISYMNNEPYITWKTNFHETK